MQQIQHLIDGSSVAATSGRTSPVFNPATGSASTCPSRARRFGDSTMYGSEGIHFYTRPKVITSRWPDPAGSAVNLGFPINH